MAMPTKTCPSCGGKGTVARERRRLPNGEPDKFDTIDWPVIVCGTCSGSGEIADPPPGGEPT